MSLASRPLGALRAVLVALAVALASAAPAAAQQAAPQSAAASFGQWVGGGLTTLGGYASSAGSAVAGAVQPYADSVQQGATDFARGLGASVGLNAAPMDVSAQANAGQFGSSGDIAADLYNMVTGRCIFCQFVGKFEQISDAYSKVIYETLRADVLRVVTYGFVIVVVLLGMKLASPLGGDPRRALGDFAMRAFLFMLAISMLSPGASGVFWNNVHGLGVKGVGEYAGKLMGLSSGAAMATGFPEPGSSCGAFSPIDEKAVMAAFTPVDPIPVQTIQAALTCQIQRMEIMSFTGVLIGQQVASSARPVIWQPSTIPGALFQMLTGIALMLAFAYALIAFPFSYIDIVARFAILGAFAPIFIGGMVFQLTRDFAKKAFTGFFATCMCLVFNSGIFGLARTMMTYAPSLYGDTHACMNTGSVPGTLLQMVKCIGDHPNEYNIADGSFWFLLGAVIVMIFMPRKVDSIVGSVFSFQFGANMGAEAAQFVRGLADTTTRVAQTAMGGGMGAARGTLGGYDSSTDAQREGGLAGLAGHGLNQVGGSVGSAAVSGASRAARGAMAAGGVAGQGAVAAYNLLRRMSP